MTAGNDDVTTAGGGESLYERLDELLADWSYELIRLTDEELVAAEQLPEDARVAITPYLDQIDDEETRQLVVACGMRALVSRGSVALNNPEELRQRVESATRKGENDVDFDLRFSPDLDLALNLRATADKIVVVEQVGAGDVRDWHYLYVHGDRFCLQEAVTAAGQRTYTLVTPLQARRQLAALADPLANAGQGSEPWTMDANTVADGEVGPLASVLERTRLVPQLMELHPAAESPQGRLFVTYLTDDETLAGRIRPGHRIRDRDRTGAEHGRARPAGRRRAAARCAAGDVGSFHVPQHQDTA